MHRRQLRSAGIPAEVVTRHVEAGILVPHGACAWRIAGVPPSWEQRVWGAVLSSPLGAVVSHRSAAHLHGIGPFSSSFIDVVRVADLPRRVVDAAPHQSTMVPLHHRTRVRGLPVTTVPRTVFDLASQVSIKRYRRGLPSLRLREVARALDDAIGRGVPVESFQAVLDELGGRGRGGTVVLRRLLAERGEGYVATESVLEDLLCAVLDRHGLPQPCRQRNIGGLDDRIGRVDFLYVDERLVIEVDGRKNHTALLDREGDAWRDMELAAAGFRVVRITWAQLNDDPRRFVSNLRKLLAPPT